MAESGEPKQGPGRPSKGDDRKQSASFALDPDVKEKLAQLDGTSRSEFVNRVLREKLGLPPKSP